jgi:hypothetical protein
MSTPTLYDGTFVRFSGACRITIKMQPGDKAHPAPTYSGKIDIPGCVTWGFKYLTPSPFLVDKSKPADHFRNIDGAAIAACGFVGYPPSDGDSDGHHDEHHDEAIVDAFNNHADTRDNGSETVFAISRREGGRVVKVAP